MKCNRKKPEACFNCTLPDCVDSGAPERAETDLLKECLPDRMLHRTDKRRKEVLKLINDMWLERIAEREETAWKQQRK